MFLFKPYHVSFYQTTEEKNQLPNNPFALPPASEHNTTKLEKQKQEIIDATGIQPAQNIVDRGIQNLGDISQKTIEVVPSLAMSGVNKVKKLVAEIGYNLTTIGGLTHTITDWDQNISESIGMSKKTMQKQVQNTIAAHKSIELIEQKINNPNLVIKGENLINQTIQNYYDYMGLKTPFDIKTLSPKDKLKILQEAKNFGKEQFEQNVQEFITQAKQEILPRKLWDRIRSGGLDYKIKAIRSMIQSGIYTENEQNRHISTDPKKPIIAGSKAFEIASKFDQALNSKRWGDPVDNLTNQFMKLITTPGYLEKVTSTENQENLQKVANQKTSIERQIQSNVNNSNPEVQKNILLTKTALGISYNQGDKKLSQEIANHSSFVEVKKLNIDLEQAIISPESLKTLTRYITNLEESITKSQTEQNTNENSTQNNQQPVLQTNQQNPNGLESQNLTQKPSNHAIPSTVLEIKPNSAENQNFQNTIKLSLTTVHTELTKDIKDLANKDLYNITDKEKQSLDHLQYNLDYLLDLKTQSNSVNTIEQDIQFLKNYLNNPSSDYKTATQALELTTKFCDEIKKTTDQIFAKQTAKAMGGALKEDLQTAYNFAKNGINKILNKMKELPTQNSNTNQTTTQNNHTNQTI